MGRSSASCHYQLSANRLISRVHVHASFKPAMSSSERDKIEIVCTGWNGLRVHCQGKAYELSKGKTFTSDMKGVDIMVDVQDARILVQWPRIERKGLSTEIHSDSTWDSENSPTRNIASVRRQTAQTSPLRNRQRLASPVSPTPAGHAVFPPPSTMLPPITNIVQVYEDAPSPPKELSSDPLSVSQATVHASQTVPSQLEASQSSSLSELNSFSDQDDENEENDPVVHSFGPFGANLLKRMDSFTAGDRSPAKPRREVRHISSSPPKRRNKELHENETDQQIANHAINQLAFSRLSSTPLSSILNHLPTEVKRSGTLSESELRVILGTVACIGKVDREGKDAAGKPLESEYYYIPDLDTDEQRKEAVSGVKPGLRSCRKQHKVNSTSSPTLIFQV